MGVYEKAVLFDETRELLEGNFLNTALLVHEKGLGCVIGGLMRGADIDQQPACYFFAGRTYEHPVTYLYGIMTPAVRFLGYMSIVDVTSPHEATTASEDGRSFDFLRRHIATTEYNLDVSCKIARAAELPVSQIPPLPRSFNINPRVVQEEFTQEWGPPSPQQIDICKLLKYISQLNRIMHGPDLR